jgi:ribosome modulation factor
MAGSQRVSSASAASRTPRSTSESTGIAGDSKRVKPISLTTSRSRWASTTRSSDVDRTGSSRFIERQASRVEVALWLVLAELVGDAR